MAAAARRNWRATWGIAAALSVLVHAAAAGVVLWRPALDWGDGAGVPRAPIQLDVTTMAMQPVGAPDTVLAPVIASVATPAPVQITQSMVPDDAGAALSPVIANSLAPTVGAPDAPETPLAPAPPEAAPTDPRLVELFDRIRNQLTEPCLLALPSLRADDQIQLALLASDDRMLPGLMAGLTRGLETDVTAAPALLDARQCPALAFARRDIRYPVLPLGIQLESRDVASGTSLRGTIIGGAGWYMSLILVDDNGVTHDLRRYLVNTGGALQFDVPVARDGAARDTNQLLVAIATPARPDAISANMGELAADFFARLPPDAAGNTLIGMASAYVR